MKYLILLLVSTAFAQKSPQAAAEKLYDAIYNIDIEGVLALSCMENTQETYERLDQIFQNENTKIRYSLTNAKYTIGEIRQIGGKSWSLINYRNVIRVTYFKKLSADEIASNKEKLKKNYHAQSINYEPNRNSYLIVYPAKFLAMSDAGSWKIIVADNTFIDDMFRSCIPEDVKKEFNL